MITLLQHRDLIITGGIGQPTVGLRIGQGGLDTDVGRIWENEEVPRHMGSPVLLEGKLFALSRMKAGHLFCLDSDTGENHECAIKAP